MAQKHKQRSSPLDYPPTASSSDSEEEEHQPSYQQHHADEEVASSEEQEENVSSEEEEDEEEEEEDQSPIPLQPPSRTLPAPSPSPAPPTNSHPKPSSSESETESDSVSDSEPELNQPTPAKVKPLASKPMEQAQKGKALPSPSLPPKSGLKRAADNNAQWSDPKRAKKKVTDSSASDDEEDGKKSGEVSKKSQRLWSEEDQLAILRGMVEFTSNTAQDPLKYSNDFHDFIKKSLHVEVSINQLKEKIRRLKKKFEINAAKAKNSDGIKFPKQHDQKAFELSKKVWGTEQVANGAVETSKSNGKLAKIPKKEGGSKNVASAKKLKPESKPEPEPASVDLKQSGKMDIDQKPDGDASLLLREISRFGNGACVYGLNENETKRGLELIGESKRVELEGKWKKLRTAEAELFAKRALLIGEQTRLILEALQSSNL
ncbi:hypothetical protein VNO77_22122 [Canavalia gladiata]|uniref:Glabrous enhancer-binding protein-like DBD domain-containing protein n=1 Tax=Canavalia gladiata TaxID=3824 RepID=A0AAN9L767_CANGL